MLHWTIYSIRYRFVHCSYFPQFVELHSASISAWLKHCIALTCALQLKMNECRIICIQKQWEIIKLVTCCRGYIAHLPPTSLSAPLPKMLFFNKLLKDRDTLTLETSISTYKFSSLNSIHFLKELVERI